MRGSWGMTLASPLISHRHERRAGHGHSSVRGVPEGVLPADRKPWQAHWIDDGPEEKLVFYCRECAEREFGEDGLN